MEATRKFLLTVLEDLLEKSTSVDNLNSYIEYAIEMVEDAKTFEDLELFAVWFNDTQG